MIGLPDGAGGGRVGRSFARALLVGVGVLVGVAALGHSVDAPAWLSADGLRRAVGVGAWYGPFCYVSTIVGGMFLPIPKIVLLGLGGVLFGPWEGFAYAWVGQVLGMTALFLVARAGLRDVTRSLVHEQVRAVRALDAHVERRGVIVVAMLRLFYFMGTPLSVLLSTTRLRLAHFMLGTAIGVVPAVALAVASGDAVTTGPTAITAAVIGIAIVFVAGVGTVVRRRLGL